MKRITAIFMVFVLAVMLTGCSKKLDEINEAIASADSVFTELAGDGQDAPETILVSVGQTFEDKNIKVTLVSVEEVLQTTPYYPMPATEGYRHMVFEFEITNNSPEDFPVSSMLGFEAYVDGEIFYINIAAIIALEREIVQLDFVVPPGETMRGVIGFLLPETAPVVEIVYARAAVYIEGRDIPVEMEPLTFTYARAI